jgi:crotonobetainyl-CoA:carnitine CoA-transferase CaiB-like acyl-CoA transferase
VQPVGDLLVPRSPVRLRDVDGERPPPPTHPPTPVGVHTRAVLLAAGFDDAAIDELAADGAVLDVWGDL